MRQMIKKLKHSIKGVAAVELALIFPIMLLMVVGALDMGSMFVRKMELANAVKAGVQYSLVRKPIQGVTTDIKTAVETSLGTSLNASTTVNVEFFWMCGIVKQPTSDGCVDPDMSSFVSIVINQDYTTPFFNYDWFIPSFSLTERSTIRLN